MKDQLATQDEVATLDRLVLRVILEIMGLME
jgi:hypothetical protein